MKDVMNDAQQTIEFLAGKVTAKEKEIYDLKRFINGLCNEIGEQARYPNIAEPGDTSDGTLRRDQFYGQTLTGAARNYLEMRKARGAASFGEIFKAVREGGYKF